MLPVTNGGSLNSEPPAGIHQIGRVTPQVLCCPTNHSTQPKPPKPLEWIHLTSVPQPQACGSREAPGQLQRQTPGGCHAPVTAMQQVPQDLE